MLVPRHEEPIFLEGVKHFVQLPRSIGPDDRVPQRSSREVRGLEFGVWHGVQLPGRLREHKIVLQVPTVIVRGIQQCWMQGATHTDPTARYLAERVGRKMVDMAVCDGYEGTELAVYELVDDRRIYGSP